MATSSQMIIGQNTTATIGLERADRDVPGSSTY
jgi:hypothetical protein